MVLTTLSRKPTVYQVDGFISEFEVEQIHKTAANYLAFGEQSIGSKQDDTGFSFELPIGENELLGNINARIY